MLASARCPSPLRLATALGSAALAATGAAQEPPHRLPGVETSRVVLEVRVTDSGGRPLPGLTPADFRLEVDGREAAVESAVWVAESTSVARVLFGPRRPDDDGLPRPPPRPPLPEGLRGQPPARSPPRHRPGQGAPRPALPARPRGRAHLRLAPAPSPRLHAGPRRGAPHPGRVGPAPLAGAARRHPTHRRSPPPRPPGGPRRRVPGAGPSRPRPGAPAHTRRQDGPPLRLRSREAGGRHGAARPRLRRRSRRPRPGSRRRLLPGRHRGRRGTPSRSASSRSRRTPAASTSRCTRTPAPPSPGSPPRSPATTSSPSSARRARGASTACASPWPDGAGTVLTRTRYVD